MNTLKEEMKKDSEFKKILDEVKRGAKKIQ